MMLNMYDESEGEATVEAGDRRERLSGIDSNFITVSLALKLLYKWRSLLAMLHGLTGR